MTATVHAILAVSLTIGPGSAIKYPAWAVDPVPTNCIPYPISDVSANAATGGWTSGRITDKLGTAMYGSLDAILQRRIFPCWYPWGPWRNLTLDEVCSTDFLPDISAKSESELEKLAYRTTSTLYFDPGWEAVYSFWKGRNAEIADPLGVYTYATNRDFSGKSVRLYAANAAADYAITNDTIGLGVSFDKSGKTAARYWMNPASLAGLTSTDFSTNAIPHDGWDSELFLFLGDYSADGYFPAGLFSRSAYSDMRGITPYWAKAYYAAKGIDSLDDVFTQARQTDGKRITNSISSLINGGKGVGLIKGTYKKHPTPRVVLDRFALLNSAASLCQTAFLGTGDASGGCPLSDLKTDYIYASPPVPWVCFNRESYSGSLIYTNSFPTNVKFIPSADSTHPENWTAKFDALGMIDAAGVKGPDIAFETYGLTVTTNQNANAAAAWYDETAYASLSASQSFGLLRSNFTVTIPTTGLLDDPFADDPDAAKGKWRLETIVGERGDVTWMLFPEVIEVDGGWMPDPAAVFADGSTSKTIGEGTLSFKDGMTSVPMDFRFIWRLDFKGRNLPDSVVPYIGPTVYESQIPDSAKDYESMYMLTNTIMSLTYAPQLYEADVVETWVDAYTTVGLSANRDDAVACADNGWFDFTCGFGGLAGVYSKYTAAPYRIGSTAGWRSMWMSLYDCDEIEGEVRECVGKFKDGISGSDASLATYYPDMKTCLAGYGADSTAEASFEKIKAELAKNDEDIMPAELSITPRAVLVENGEIPYDFVCGSITLTINIPVDASDVRRSSIAVGHVRKGLPFAEWKFPAMSVEADEPSSGPEQ